MLWNSREQVEREFPPDRHNYVPIASEDEGRMRIAVMAVKSGKPVSGEVRWFGPTDGVLIFEKTRPLLISHEQVEAELDEALSRDDAKPGFFRRLFSFIFE